MPQARHTPNPLFQHPKVRRALRALLGAAACFAVCFFVWLSAVRPASGKSLSEGVCQYNPDDVAGYLVDCTAHGLRFLYIFFSGFGGGYPKLQVGKR